MASRAAMIAVGLVAAGEQERCRFAWCSPRSDDGGRSWAELGLSSGEPPLHDVWEDGERDAEVERCLVVGVAPQVLKRAEETKDKLDGSDVEFVQLCPRRGICRSKYGTGDDHQGGH